ncbi:hypothetical protein J14TS2_02930 [Bacillus sp. J14TS2]|uniref:hypothetical protein n=1 Tax=Bacillus sp. J14TS2 TaxID=2807188 RepID=UPI001AFCEBCF|nr:hypothetical protein [Bacillus sp. J14TS2]GIN69818.1 hypothetical protein J14TS2_02930 [Bacillus sp. J14TS2]
MSHIVRKWTERISNAWALQDFQLKSATIRREVSPIQTTEYRLEIEWFPPGTAMIDDLNPPGTVYAEVNLTLDLLTSFIVVQNEDLRKKPLPLSSTKQRDVVAWIQENTGLQQKVDYELEREEQGENGSEYFFTSRLAGRKISPGGYLEVKINSEGVIVFFTLTGFFSKFYPKIQVEAASEEEPRNIEEWKNQQVILFGTLKESGYQLLYGVEEAFLDDVEERFILEWSNEKSIQKIPRSEHKPGKLWEDFRKSHIISEEEMDSSVPHPDAIPISQGEREACFQVITDYMRMHRPNESGKWVIERLERQHGMIEASVSPISTLDRIMDKFKFVYDSKDKSIIEILNKRELFEDLVDSSIPKPQVTKEEATAILNQDIFFEPYYLYDRKQKRLKSTWMIDCHMFVDAQTGKKIWE